MVHQLFTWVLPFLLITSNISVLTTATDLPKSASDSQLSSRSDDSAAAACNIAVTFSVLKTTKYGENVFLTGADPAIGAWNTSTAKGAIVLSASHYTAANPVWQATVTLPSYTTSMFKYFVVGTDGKTITWELDPNRSFSTAGNCGGTYAVDGTF